MEYKINSNDLYELLLNTVKGIRSKLNKVNDDDINIDFNKWKLVLEDSDGE